MVGPIQLLWRSSLLLPVEVGHFIAAWSIARGDGNVEQAEINAELAAMVIPMVEHNAPQKRRARHGQQRVPAIDDPERVAHTSVVDRGQCFSNVGGASIQRFQNVAKRSGLRSPAAEVRQRRLVGFREAQNAFGCFGDVQGELADGHRLFVRLPSKLPLGYTFDKRSRCAELLFELGKK